MTNSDRNAVNNSPFSSGPPTPSAHITVWNKLPRDRGNINIYHHYTRGTYIISRGHSVKIPLMDRAQGDYLHIGVNRGGSRWGGDCRIIVPIWLDLEFSSPGDCILKHTQEGNRLNALLILPPGPSSWEMTVTYPAGNNIGPAPPKDRECSIVIGQWAG